MLSSVRIGLLLVIGLSAVVGASCSDDDGSDVQPKGPPTMGGSAGDGMGGAAGSDTAGSGGSGGSSGTGGSGGSSGGPPDCTPVDAGAPDAGDAGDGDAGLGDASADGGISGIVSFAADIHPIFVASCGPCHVTDFAAGHNIGSEDVDQAYADAVDRSEAVLQRTNGGGMPPSCAGGPGDPGCLTVDEYALIQTWVAQCYPR